MGYWSVAILFWQLSIDHLVNVLYKRWALAKTRLRHHSLPFDSLPYPTRTICRRVRTYARSITWQPSEKRLTIFHEYGALSNARFARAGAPVMPNNSAASRAVFLIPKISHIIRHCKFVLHGGCFFLKKLKLHVLFKLEQRTRRRKKLSLNRVFSLLDNSKWKMHTGARARKQKYLSIYISLYMKTFLKTGVDG